MEHPGERDEAREAGGVGCAPLPRRLAVGGARGGEQRVRRGDALDEEAPRPEEEEDLAGDARLGGGEEGFEPSALVPNAVTDNVVWDCVTCGACVRECPVSIEHVDHIVDLRRHLVMMDSSFPSESEQMLRDVERASNPWGKPQTERADWPPSWG